MCDRTTVEEKILNVKQKIIFQKERRGSGVVLAQGLEQEGKVSRQGRFDLLNLTGRNLRKPDRKSVEGQPVQDGLFRLFPTPFAAQDAVARRRRPPARSGS